MENNLTYSEAMALALQKPWKLTLCEEGDKGEKCWCRMVEPEERIEDKDGNEIYIVGSGRIPKEFAEHFVKLHNESLNPCKSAKELTEEEFIRHRKNSATIKELREAIKDLPDDGSILVQRVEDFYYVKNNWGVVKKEGYWYDSHLRMNQKMRDEIERREIGLPGEFEMDDPNKYILTEEEMSEMKDEYTLAQSTFTYNDDKENLFINLHY